MVYEYITVWTNWKGENANFKYDIQNIYVYYIQESFIGCQPLENFT